MKIMYEDIHIGIESPFHSNYFRKRTYMNTNKWFDEEDTCICGHYRKYHDPVCSVFRETFGFHSSHPSCPCPEFIYAEVLE